MKKIPSLPTVEQRIVLQQTTGPLTGLYRIMGTTIQLQKGSTSPTLPPLLKSVNFGDHVAACSLVKVKPRYVLYREIVTPEGPVPQPVQQ